MLFYIMSFIVFAYPFAAWAAVTFRFRSEEAIIVIGFMAFALSALTVLTSWGMHASDLSKINHQSHRIAVYEKRIESLKSTLKEANYPAKGTVSFDADSPWSTITRALNDAETDLSRAADERARAIIAVEARRNGPMSGTISFVGDYEL